MEEDKDKYPEGKYVRKHFTPEKLKDFLYKYFGKTRGWYEKSRKRQSVYIRHFVAFTIKQYFEEPTLGQLASYMGVTNHASVLHAIKTIQDQLDVESGYKFKRKPYTMEWEGIRSAIKLHYDPQTEFKFDGYIEIVRNELKEAS